MIFTITSRVSKSEHPNIETPTAFIIKGKAIPLQAWTVPEVSRMLRLPDFKTVGT
jgi:hypothetical protein